MQQIGLVIIAVVILFYILLYENKQNEKCRLEGGVPIRGYYSFVCVKGIEEVEM